jgi:acyl carrier protein
MMTTPSTARSSVKTFPANEVETRLRVAITRLGEDTSAMREPWEPQFDSLAVVNVVLVVESVLPDLKISPEKVVRKGGYATVEDAVNDITNRLRLQWERR